MPSAAYADEGASVAAAESADGGGGGADKGSAPATTVQSAEPAATAGNAEPVAEAADDGGTADGNGGGAVEGAEPAATADNDEPTAEAADDGAGAAADAAGPAAGTAAKGATGVLADDDIASGTSGTCTWTIDKDGVLTISEGELETSKVRSSAPWKDYASEIKSVSITGKVKADYFTDIFRGCVSLESIDVSNLDTSETTSLIGMFYGCSSLKSITGLSNFNTSIVVDMGDMFYGCRSLTSIDGLSSFDTSKVDSMQDMFAYCSSLTSLDLSGFDTSSVTKMGSMFAYCSSLTSIEGLSSFDTSNVESMRTMFRGCSSLTSLDLSEFDTSKVTDMRNMFEGCSSLKTIYASSLWSTSSLGTEVNPDGWDDSDTFKNCNALVGGIGTTYNASNVNASYAKIDGGTDNPGYLTKGTTKAEMVTAEVDDLKEPAEITVSDEAEISQARADYDALNPYQKTQVSEDTVAKLEAAEDALAAAKVTDQIENLPPADELTAKDADAVKAARDAYDALTEGAKDDVSDETVKKLEDAEAALKAAEEAADAVTEQINDLPENPGVDDADAVEAARDAYDSLSDAAKSYVSDETVKRLEDAEAAVKAAQDEDADDSDDSSDDTAASNAGTPKTGDDAQGAAGVAIALAVIALLAAAAAARRRAWSLR